MSDINTKNRADHSSSNILTIASSNPGKVDEFRDLLAEFNFCIQPQPKGLDIKEIGKTFSENAFIKAKAVALATKQNAIADDSGLCVRALNGAPGVASARFASTDPARIAKLLDLMKGVEDRSAYFCTALCIVRPNGKIFANAIGQCNGTITFSARGKNGFGYDPVFEEKISGKTFSEMSSEKKQHISHRGRAFALIKPKIQALFDLSNH